MKDWIIVILVVIGLILLYFLSAGIVFLLMKRAKNKTFKLLEDILPLEQKRFDSIIKLKTSLEEDGRVLPKNLREALETAEKAFQKIPVDYVELKGNNDFLIMYFRKYLSEKRLLNKEAYQTFDKELEKNLFLDPTDKTSPYYEYNKKASVYNAYLGMTILALFGIRRRYPTAPIL